MSRRSRHPAPRQVPQQPSTTLVAHHQQRFTGPLPPPTALAEFDRVLPGLAERITRMAEGHAHDTWRNNRSSRIVSILGQVFAFVLLLVAIGAGVFLTLRGFNVAGIGTILTAIAAPLVAMLRKTSKD